MYFDSHAHYDDGAYDNDRDEIVSSLPNEGITNVVNISADMSSMDSTIELSKRYKHVYAAIGVHPSETDGLTMEDMARIKRNCDHEKVVAIGEIGLDYHWDDSVDRNIQKKWFERQILIAQEVDLPIVVHSRDAGQDTLDMMRALHCESIGGVIHCYSYSREMASQFMKMDFYFGIGGAVTYKNSKKLRESVAYIPIDRILLETDCPYLPPDGHRGERNDSRYLPIIAKAVAEIKGMKVEDVVRITRENAFELFRIY